MEAKEKTMRILAVVLVAISLAMLLSVFVRWTRAMSNTIERLESNVTAMRGEMERNTSKDGKETASVGIQTLTKSELRDVMREELKTLSIKPRDVRSATTIESQNTANVRFDTVVLRDTIREYRYTDDWITLVCTKDSAHVVCRDCLLVVNHCKTRKFLWWTIRKYSGKTTIKNYSPYSTIEGINSVNAE